MIRGEAKSVSKKTRRLEFDDGININNQSNKVSLKAVLFQGINLIPFQKVFHFLRTYLSGSASE